MTLENFLVEASDTSPDCRRARDALLVNFADWPASGGGKRQWITFLTLLGVADGLRPVAGRVQESGLGWSWKYLVDNGDSKEALDRDWCREASAVSFPNPYTEYRRGGLGVATAGANRARGTVRDRTAGVPRTRLPTS